MTATKHFTFRPKLEPIGDVLTLSDKGEVMLNSACLPEFTAVNYQVDQSFVDYDYLVTYTAPRPKSRLDGGNREAKKFTNLGNHKTPEKGLLAAMVWRAIEDLRSTQPQIRREAYAWLTASQSFNLPHIKVYPSKAMSMSDELEKHYQYKDYRYEPFTFRWICSELGVNYNVILSQIDEHITITYMKKP